jgi:hypothetical protein
MGKFIKQAMFVTAGLIAVVGGIILIINYWDRILSLGVATKQLGTNVLKSLSSEQPEKDDPSDYFDI